MKRILLTILLLSSLVFGRKIVVKLATLAPEGTDWHGMLIDMGQEWKKTTKGTVQLRIYPGGVLGDERDMVRKMRIGQIHAAGITTEGLSEIVPDFSGFFVPMAFQTSEDVQTVVAALLPNLEKKLESNGFKLLCLGNMGWAYWFSTKQIKTPDDLKKMKLFSWAGDYKWEQVWKNSGYDPIALASTDILPGFQTGLINTLSTMPLYALAQQIFGIANHMLDLKWGVLMAGIVVDMKTWNRIPDKYHEELISITNTIQAKHQNSTRNAELQAIEAMKDYGLSIHTINEQETALWQAEVVRIESYLRGNVIPESIYDTVIELTKKQ